MGLKQSNEITVKIKCEVDEFYKILEDKGFEITDKFSLEDAYFIPETLNLEEMSVREILAKALLVRECIGKISGNVIREITFKRKNFDENGNILSQDSVNCNVYEIEDAKKLLKAIGYKEIMCTYEDDIVYGRNGLELAIKNIRNGDKLFEVETLDQEGFETTEKLIERVKELELPIYTDNFFVKKAEVELSKVLDK